MSEGGDFLSELHRTDPWIRAITSERIAVALEGFPLPLAEGWDWTRLARSIQDTANAARGDPPQSDADAKAELVKLADKAKALHRAISRMGETAEIAAFWEAFRHLQVRQNANRIDYDDDYKPLMLDSLETIANILAGAASQAGTQRKQAPRWQEKHRQERRIGFAIALTPVFQSAFDTPARANNWHVEYGDEHPWPEFYRRIYVELFPGSERLNLPKVLQEAARQLPHVEAMKQWLDEQEATLLENSGE